MKSYEGKENFIFVSYAHKDSGKVLPILEELSARGYRIWYDEGIAPGSEWPENIAYHLSHCAIVLAFVTPSFAASPNCRRETTFALSKDKPFVGVFLEETALSPGMELQLSAQQCLFREKYPTQEAFIEKLATMPELSSCQAPVQPKKEEPKPVPIVEAKVGYPDTKKAKWYWVALGTAVLIGIILLIALLSRGCHTAQEPGETSTESVSETEEDDGIDNPKIEGLASIQVESQPDKLLYHVGDSFDQKGLSITAIFEDETQKTVTEGFKWFPETLEEAGTQEIKLYYGGKTAKLSVVVSQATLTELTVKQNPERTEYYLGEVADLTGLTLIASYSDGSSETVTNGFTATGDAFKEAGDAEITVGYGDLSVRIPVTVSEVALSRIEIEAEPESTVYFIGDALNLAGLKVKAFFNDGSEKSLDSGFTVSPMKLEKKGTQEITVSYGSKTVAFSVNVSDLSVESIAVKTQPTKKDYFAGDTVSTQGLVLSVKYTNGTTEDVTKGFTVSPSVLNNEGNQKVTVSYANSMTNFTVSVKPPTLNGISVKTMPTVSTYKIGESLKTGGLTLNASYSNGKQETILSGFTVSPTNFTAAGEQTITVVYQGKQTTFKVTVMKALMTGISVKTPVTQTTYFVGDTLKTAGLTLTASFDDGKQETVTSGFTVSPSTLSASGTQKITVSYEGKTTTFNVTVQEVMLNELKLDSAPQKLSYLPFETYSNAGLSVTAVYNNGVSRDVTQECTVGSASTLQIGTQTVQASYGGKSVSFDVTVSAAVGNEVTFGGVVWKVIEVNGTYIRVISKNLVAKMAYSPSSQNNDWQTSNVRSYLNGTFVNQIPAEIRAKIRRNTSANNDEVFILSTEYAKKFLPSDAARVATLNGVATDWWTRDKTQFAFQYFAGYIKANGQSDQALVTNEKGVRPCIMFDLN